MTQQGTLSCEPADDPESPFADESRERESVDRDHGQAGLRGWGESQATIDSYGSDE